MRTLIVKQEIKFNTINNIRTYLNDRIFELRKLSYDTNHENPYIFMGISAIFDLLSYLPYDDRQMEQWKNNKGVDLVGVRYKQFLKDYVFDEIKTNYPLEELFYKRVRCGLDHAFSVGNSNSVYVLLSHERTDNPEEILIEEIDGNLSKGIIFNASGMVDLLIHSIHKIFNEVNDNKISEQQIINRFCCKMPISNLYEDKIIQTFQINIPNVSG